MLAECPNDEETTSTDETGAFDLIIDGGSGGKNPEDALTGPLELCDDEQYIAKPNCPNGLARIMQVTMDVIDITKVTIILQGAGGNVIDSFEVSVRVFY